MMECLSSIPYYHSLFSIITQLREYVSKYETDSDKKKGCADMVLVKRLDHQILLCRFCLSNLSLHNQDF